MKIVGSCNLGTTTIGRIPHGECFRFNGSSDIFMRIKTSHSDCMIAKSDRYNYSNPKGNAAKAYNLNKNELRCFPMSNTYVVPVEAKVCLEEMD